MMELEISYKDGNRTRHSGVSNLAVNKALVAFVEDNIARSIPMGFVEYVSLLSSTPAEAFPTA